MFCVSYGHSYVTDYAVHSVVAPRYTVFIMATPLNGSMEALFIPGYTANPAQGVTVNWSRNGTAIENSTLPDQLNLGQVHVNDSGNYTVHTCNMIGCGTGTLGVDVYCK